MEINKKFGTIVMVFSVILWFALLSIAKDICYADAPAAASTLKWLSFCVRFPIDFDSPNSILLDGNFIPGTYLTLGFSVILAIGFLWYRNAIPVPPFVSKLLSSDGQQ